MKKIYNFILLVLIVFSQRSYCFDLAVNVIHETCPGNGSMTFQLSNNQTGSTVLFIVYKLPDTTTPYASITSPQLNGVSSGDYLVVAQVTTNGVTEIKQNQVHIENNIVPLNFEIQSFNQACSSSSTISVNVLGGTASGFEIFEGPITFNLQSSPVFADLPPGVYKIRVFDSCGGASVTTYTVEDNEAGLILMNPVTSSQVNPSCISYVLNNILLPVEGSVLAYPIQIYYTIFPPNGYEPIIISSSLTSGDLFAQPISVVVPQYVNQSATCQIEIVDGCGIHYTFSNVINSILYASHNVIHLPCNENFFNIQVTNFTPPFTIEFFSYPLGFSPNEFNSAFPGPYSNAPVSFGSDSQPVPEGDYSLIVTDACGRFELISFSIFDAPPTPIVVGSNNSCLIDSGTISITIPDDEIVSAIVLSAPDNYPYSLPQDVSNYINSSGNLVLTPIPTGEYTLSLTEYCNDQVTTVSVVVPEYIDKGLEYESLPGCSIGKGSISLKSKNAKLITVQLIDAPVEYSFSLPHNVSNQVIQSGVLYMNDLPPGDYTFVCIDDCAYTNSITINVVGYQIDNDELIFVENCGSFDVALNFISNGVLGQSYWLQKMISPGVWGNPITNIVYVEGSLPNGSNSIQLYNTTSNLNFMFNGTFRVVRRFVTFNNGQDINAGLVSSVGKNCIEILNPFFEFNEALDILDANRMPCNVQGDLDVILNVVGTQPLDFSIIKKDGIDFFVDNQQSNIFYNLPPAVYTFQVEDACGNIVTKIFDVNALNSLINFSVPNSILLCQEIITSQETFDFSEYNELILNNIQNQLEYTLTYHLNLDDANLGINAITNTSSFNPITNPQKIYVRIVFNPIPDCYSLTSFDLVVGQIPHLNLQDEYLNCSDKPITISIAPEDYHPTTVYQWSNGEVGQSITVEEPGVSEVSVTAINEYADIGICTNTKFFTVINSKIPIVDKVITEDWSANENTIQVVTSNTGDFEYSIDGLTYQSHNVFTDLMPGTYTVHVRDVHGCGLESFNVWLLYYNKFFTPNNDGINEKWRIKFSEREDKLTVYIYDRYGKLITYFDSDSAGWDGTYNGHQAISDDYWFVVNRQDGRVHKGHFTLKR